MGFFADFRRLEGSRQGYRARSGLVRAEPEDVFLAWLLHLPDGADVAEAARREIVTLDRAAPLPPKLARLRSLMVETAECSPGPARPRTTNHRRRKNP